MDATTARNIFTYDPEEGCLRWAKKTHHNIVVGEKAARLYKKSSKYSLMRVAYKGRHYKEHRVIWLYFYGKWPDGYIDHINGNPVDNRLSNLRDVSPQESACNRSTPIHNTTGVIGVRKTGPCKYVAKIVVNNKPVYLGTFYDLEEAATVRRQAEQYYGFHRNHGRHTYG